MGWDVGLSLPEDVDGLRAALFAHVACHVAHRDCHGGVLDPKGGYRDAPDSPPELPKAGFPYAVAYEVDDAALPGGASEDLAHGPDQPPAGVRRHELDARDAAVAYPLQEASHES